MNNESYEGIVFAVGSLLEDDKANKENIRQCRKDIAELRQKIRGLTDELKQQHYDDGSDEYAEASIARDMAVNADCKFLKEKLISMAGFVKEKNTAEALTLLKPMQSGLSLLKLRVRYIDQLEKLLQSYAKEIRINKKFERLAEALNLEVPDADNMEYAIAPMSLMPSTGATLH